MDIRDFRDFRPVKDGEFPLETMYSLQKNLLVGYIKIEKLPPYPVALNDPQAQVLLKDFTARVVEELGEMYESYLVLCQTQYIALYKEADISTLTHALYNLNEELADAIHFMIELLIYSGVEFNKFLSDPFLIPYESDPPKSSPLSKIPITLTNTGGRVCRGILEPVLWRVTYTLQLARNTLKNKPWKQSQMVIDEQAYRAHLITATRELAHVCWILGMDVDSVFNTYLAKNQVNRFRQKSRY
jgi:hypothetical protein